MPPLLWWSASIFFLGGSIHQLISPLNPLTIACLAILPPLLLISWISAHVKPTADEGAAAADRLFDANSLFVSAWELSRSAASPKGISRLLLARAEKKLPGWSASISKHPQRYMKPASLAATSLGLIGLFFLLQPAHVQTSDVSSAIPSSQKKSLNQSQDPAVVLSELFTKKVKTTAVEQPLQQNSAFNSTKKVDTQTPQQNRPLAIAKINKDGPKTAGQTTMKMSAKPSTPGEKSLPAQDVFPASSSPNKSKKIADQIAGNDTAVSTDRVINKAEKFARVSLTDIETGADTRSTAFDVNREGDELIVSTATQSPFHQPPARNSMKVSQTSAGTLLTAEQSKALL